MKWLALLSLAGCAEFATPGDVSCGVDGACPDTLRCEPVVDRCVARDLPPVAAIRIDPWPASLEVGPAPAITAALVDAAGARVPVSGGSFAARVLPGGGAGASPAVEGAIVVAGLGLDRVGPGQRIEVAGGGLVATSPPFAVRPSRPVVGELTPPAASAGCVEVGYTLTQAQGLPVDVLVEIDPDGAGPLGYRRATQAASSPGQTGVSALAGRPEGRRVSFLWDASFDLPDVSSEARLRVTGHVGDVVGAPAVVDLRVEQAASVEVVAFPPADVLRILDVDRDGWPDELGAIGSELTVRFRGTNPVEAVLQLPAEVRDIASVDIDGDRRLDLAVATDGAGVQLLHQPARRQLVAGQALAAWPSVRQVTAGDVDQDGDDDLFLATDAGGVHAYEHLAPGWSQDFFVAQTGPRPGFVVGPFDLPQTELLVGDEESALRVFSQPFATPPGATVLPVVGRPVLAEVDRDLLPDLVLVGGRLVVSSGDDTVDLALPAEAAAVVDLDGDARSDLVVATSSEVLLIEREGKSGLFFAPPRRLAELSGVTRLDVVDHDRDGRPDLIAHQPGATHWLRNRTPRRCAVRLGGPVLSAAVPDTQPPLLADLDGDGKADVVQAGDEIHASFGRGDGGFAAPVRLATAAGPVGDLLAADLDGHGGSELLFLVPGEPSLGILRVAAPDEVSLEMLGTGGEASALAAGDVDADGALDVVLLRAGFVEVLRGDPDRPGHLLVGKTMPAPASLCTKCDALLADVDGDGALELVAAGTERLDVLRLDAAGGLVAIAGADAPGSRLEGVADLVGDAGAEIFATQHVDNAVEVVAWKVDGASLARSWSIHGSASTILGKTIATDLGGDGVVDLALAFAGGTCTITPRTIAAGSELVVEDCLDAFEAEATADLDGDGLADLLGRRTSRTDRLVALTTARSAGRLDAGSRLDVLAENHDEADIGDFDRDGLLDVIAHDTARGSYTIAYQSPTNPGTLRPGGSLSERAVTVVDLDRDRCADVLTPRSAQLFQRSSCDGLFAARCPGQTSGSEPSVADVDGDGWPDVVFADAGRVRMFAAPGRPAACAPPIDLVVDPLYQVGQRLTLVDVDLDGRTDLVSLGSMPAVSRQSPDGTFSPPVRLAGPLGLALAVADVDRDGFADLLTTANEQLRVHRGAGDGGFGVAHPVLDQAVLHVDVVDVDRDGWLDLLADSMIYRQVAPLVFDRTGELDYWPERDSWRSTLLDFDRDGQLDLLRATRPSGLVLFRGR